MASATFSGSSAYQATLTASVSGSTVTAVLKVSKLSGAGYWTASSVDFGLSIDGVSYNGTWTYDFRNTTTITVKTQSRNTGYTGNVSVRAWVEMASGIGRAPSSGTLGVTVKVATDPSAPGTPSVSNITSSSAKLSWNLPANNGASLDDSQFQIDDNSSFSSPSTTNLSGNSTSYTRTGLANAKTYWARVRFHNSEGWGSWSGARSFTTLAVAPDAPGTPSVSSITSSSVALSWSAPDDGGASITGYDVQWATNSSFSGASTATQSGLTRTISGLAPGTTYYFRVRATNSIGDSSWSGTRSATTEANPPDAPSGLVLTGRTSSSLSVSWDTPDGNGAPVTSYELQRDTSSGFPAPGAAIKTGTTHTSTGLEPGETSYFRVRATNSAGTSGWSATLAATTLAAPPEPPTGLAISNIGPTSMTLSWTAPSDTNGAALTGYTIERALNSAFTSGKVQFTQGTGTSRSFADLEPGTRYYFRVAATNSAGTGTFSSATNEETTSGAYYSTGSVWLPCGVFVSDGTAWEAGELSVSDGSAWIAAI